MREEIGRELGGRRDRGRGKSWGWEEVKGEIILRANCMCGL